MFRDSHQQWTIFFFWDGGRGGLAARSQRAPVRNKHNLSVLICHPSCGFRIQEVMRFHAKHGLFGEGVRARGQEGKRAGGQEGGGCI